MSTRAWWLIAVLAVAIGALLLFTRQYRVEKPPLLPPPVVPAPPADPPQPATFPGTRPTSDDPLLKKWQTSIAQRDQQGVLAAQSAFLEREGEYRERLVTMAKEDPDARIRAFSVAVLGRMKAPPPEQFFIERLSDASPHPQSSALEALKKVGSAACLPEVDRVAASGADDVKAVAAQTAKVVRSR
jgi:hypothetical protein